MKHERDVFAARPIFLGLAALALTVLLGWAIPTWLQAGLVARRQESLPAANPLSAAFGRKVPPSPRLQVNPDRDIAAYRAAQAARLNGYGWVDRRDGIVHIPIERAMAIVADRVEDTR